jgi:hypothetical protein
MIDFIVSNLGTIIVGLIVLAIIVAIIVKKIKDRKAGKSSCSCGCSNCPSSSMCHKN